MAVIAFRLDGGAAIGSGHLVRCGALGEALQDLGHQVIFLCRNPLPKVPPFPIRYFAPPLPAPPPGQYGVQDISDELPALQRTLEEDRIDCLIVDHYGAVEDYLSALQGQVGLLAALDDIHPHPFPVDLVLNGNVYAEELSYPEADSALLGPIYLPLRREFRDVSPKPIHSQARRIYITSGGADPLGFCRTALEWISAAGAEARDIFVIAGSGFTPAYLEELAADPLKPTLIQQANMRACMEDADLFITSAGSTLYELAACGTPSLSCILTENQAQLALRMGEQGCTHCLGPLKEVSTVQAIEALSCLLRTQELRREMRHRMNGCIFSTGAETVANYLHQRITHGRAIGKGEIFSTPQFICRGITFADSSQISLWRSNPDLIRFFSNPEPVSLEMQQRWFLQSYLTDGNRFDFLVLAAGTKEPVGFVGASHIDYDKGSCYLGYAIAQDSWRGRRCASELVSSLITFLCRSLGIHTFFAVVHRENFPSCRLVTRLGFSPMGREGDFITYRKIDFHYKDG